MGKRNLYIRFLVIIFIITGQLFYSCVQYKQWELGTTDLWGSGSVDSLQSAISNGFKWLEVNIAAHYNWGTDSNSINKSKLCLFRMKEKADSAGIQLWSGHLSYGNRSDISQNDDTKRLEAVVNIQNQVRLGKEILGVKYFILHPSFEPISNEERAKRMINAKQSIVQIQTVADELGAVVCVESLPRTCLGNTPEELMELIEGTNARICYDVNHYSLGTVNHFIEVTKDKLVTLHLSDFEFENERHWLPGQGKINWNELLRLLKNSYNGVLMSEALKDRTNNKAITMKQLKDSYDFILDDFYNTQN